MNTGGLLAGNLNVTVTVDQDNLARFLFMVFVLIVISALAIKLISKV